MAKKSYKKKVNVFKGESNPFNLKVNREKRCILGQRVRGTKGLRGVSRAASHAKRKELWHKTKISVQKSNKFLDKRIFDESLQPEENTANMLVKERKLKFKKNIFNLNDEELELTHEGKPLSTFENVGGVKADSDDEELLDSSYVHQAHFGGFEENKSTWKSHKEVLDDLILESKTKKYERKLENEKNEEMIDNLDKGWKELLVVSGIKGGNTNSKPDKQDPYDIITQELKFEKRGAPSSRIKSAEELELEEKEKMKNLEEQRLLRMADNLEFKSKKANDHLSADSIIDDYDIQSIPVEENVRDEVASQHSNRDTSGDEESDDGMELQSENEEINEYDDESVLQATKIVETLFGNKGLSTFPLTIEELEDIVERSDKNVNEIVGEILKPYATAKAESKLTKLATFFDILIQFALNNLDSDPNISCHLAEHLFMIIKILPLKCGEIFLSYLDKEQQFFHDCKGKKKKSSFPRSECILLLKYSTIFYSVSDFRHPIVTPAVIFMCDILSSVFRITFQNIISRLFICNLIFDCVSQSKRFVPEVLYFLNKLLYLAIDTRSNPDGNEMASKKLNLVLKSNKPVSNEIVKLSVFKFDKTISADSVKLAVISKSVDSLHKFADLYKDLPSFPELFDNSLSILSKLNLENYATKLKDSIHNFTHEIKANTKVHCHLVFKNTKPRPLKLFEPAFESKFNKQDDIKKKFKVIKQVEKKIKKEEKGVLREMRRDGQMIAAEKLAETLENDSERKRKVKELYHDLAVQEGEFKKMMKKRT